MQQYQKNTEFLEIHRWTMNDREQPSHGIEHIEILFNGIIKINSFYNPRVDVGKLYAHDHVEHDNLQTIRIK